MRRTSALLLLAFLLLIGTRLAGTTGFSDATFTSSSASSGTVRAAADWTPPTAVLTNPGSPLQGTVTLTATASDAQSAITSVVFQYLAPGSSTWTTLCTSATAPYSCAWNTKAVTDGIHDLRVRATNSAGYATTSEEVRTTVANNVLVVLGDPGDIVRGSVPLTSTVHNGGLLPWIVTVQYAPAGTTTWKTLCTGLSSPFSCTWNTTGFASDYYDLRTMATSGFTTVYSAVITDVLVDNTAPTVTMTDPGTPLRGTVTFGANAADEDSGINQVVLQYSRAGGAYQTLCTIATDPFTCRFATTALADGTYAFRAVATDAAGNTTTSSAVTNRVVDNTVASVSVDDPGAWLTGTVTISAQASSSAGIASVRIQRAPTGTSTWTDLCTDASAPYSCTWATTTVGDGSYDLRAVLLDSRGVSTTSAIVSARRVDNSPLRGVDVQTTNGTGTAGRIDAGDTITLTYSRPVATTSITSGWTGAALPVSVRLRDGNLLGLGSKGDTVDVQRNGSTIALGSILLRENYIKASKTLVLNATMTATTVTVDGVERTVVTLVLGTVASGSGQRTASAATAITWTPSASATSPTGTACSTSPVTESGNADREF
ncbi:signal peptidase I [Nocardioides sp. Root190]|uniref:Ig-like domain-containing protein n=1 Tax=Nocardioides sp. Root190 TaxID=1736488 RepID=UPI0006FA0BEC|nr:Ig-like domain-containing protein [Nocardioides sp. Root190]KRB78332.1 signal peptidase I [Nocardioides sp. Root190]